MLKITDGHETIIVRADESADAMIGEFFPAAPEEVCQAARRPSVVVVTALDADQAGL